MQSSFAARASLGRLNGLALAVAACLGWMAPDPAGVQAQEPVETAARTAGTITVDIPAGRLSNVLENWANQAGVLLSADSRFLAGLNSPGLRGTYGVEQGFAALLGGHGLEVQRNSQGIYVVRPAPGSKASVAELDAVEVAGQYNNADKPFQTAGSAQYISRDHIERFRGSSVGDMFQGTPGVLVAENRNSGGLDVNIRGMQGQGRVPVLIDGARQETTVYRGYGGVVSRSYVDPDLIGGVDISKGPVMTADGAGAIGGVVSMRTINANDILMPGKTTGVRMRGTLQGNSRSAPEAGTPGGLYLDGVTGYVTDCANPAYCEGREPPASYGGDDLGVGAPSLFNMGSWSGSIAAAARFEKIDLVAAYARRHQGNYFTGKHGPVPEVNVSYIEKPFYTEVSAERTHSGRYRAHEEVLNSQNISESLLLKSNILLPGEQDLELSFMRYDSEYGEMMPSQLVGFDAIRQTSGSHVTANTFAARHHWDPSGTDLVDLRTNVWATRTKSMNRSYSDNWDSLGSFIIIPTPEKYKRYGGDISNTMRFDAWGEHNLSFGMAVQREDADTERPLDSRGNPAANSSYGRVADRSEFSSFINWQWQPHPTVTMNAGLRYMRATTNDKKAIDVAANIKQCTDVDKDSGDCVAWEYVPNPDCVDSSGSGACDPNYMKTRNSGTAPVFSLTWEPLLNGLQFYGRYAEGLRMPSLFESSQGWSVSPSEDRPLKAERAINRELGLNYLRNDAFLPGDRLGIKLARFSNRTNDYLTRTSPNRWDSDAAAYFTMRNIDSVSIKGSELMVEYDMGVVYGQVGGSYYDDVEVCHYGSGRRDRCNDYGVKDSYFNNMIPPKWHGSAILGTRLFNQTLDLGMRATFVGKRNQAPDYDDVTANGLLFIIPWERYTLFDVYASWKQSEHLTVTFNIDNLTDRYYYDALGLGYVPAPGRTARLGVTLQY